MPSPRPQSVENSASLGFVPRMRQLIIGLAQDFWKDGTDHPFRSKTVKTASAVLDEVYPAQPVQPPKVWHAEPGEILEKMWGDGFIVPGDAELVEVLLEPLKMVKDTTVLDLSAGLGGRMQLIGSKYGATVTGLEADSDIAARAMDLAITAGKDKNDLIAIYDPSGLSLAKKYDCIVARDIFHRVEDKSSFFTAIVGCMQPKAQIAFTDYILNPEDRDKPAIVKWLACEKNVTPLSLVEMAEAWARLGITLSVHEDQTPFYRKQVAAGLRRLAVFLAGPIKPDAATKKDVLATIQIWVHHLAALEQGVKFYRFYGTRH